MSKINIPTILATLGAIFFFDHPQLLIFILYVLFGRYIQKLSKLDSVTDDILLVIMGYWCPFLIFIIFLIMSDDLPNINKRIKSDLSYIVSNKYYILQWPIKLNKVGPPKSKHEETNKESRILNEEWDRLLKEAGRIKRIPVIRQARPSAY